MPLALLDNVPDREAEAEALVEGHPLAEKELLTVEHGDGVRVRH